MADAGACAANYTHPQDGRYRRVTRYPYWGLSLTLAPVVGIGVSIGEMSGLTPSYPFICRGDTSKIATLSFICPCKDHHETDIEAGESEFFIGPL